MFELSFPIFGTGPLGFFELTSSPKAARGEYRSGEGLFILSVGERHLSLDFENLKLASLLILELVIFAPTMSGAWELPGPGSVFSLSK